MTALEERPIPSVRWAGCLLIVLSTYIEPGESMELTQAHEEATKLALARTPGEEIQYTTQRSAKRELVELGLVIQERRKRHFHLRITDEGRAQAQLIMDNPDWAAGGAPANAGDLSGVNLVKVRVGKGHLLPRSEWKRMNTMVGSGEIDILLIPRDSPTPKIPYWDEQ